jgi:hypothetical protein
MEDGTAPISLAGSHLKETRHVCAFFNSDEEEYRVLLPFIKDGFTCGHRAVHIVNPDQQQDHRHRLASAGIDTAAAEQTGQLDLRTSADTYLSEGRFDPDRMLETFSRMARGDARDGYGLRRIVCRMDWAGDSRVFIDNVIEFESRVNDLWRRHDHAVICTYRLSQFSGDAVIDIMRTHPLIIMGGILQRNPFYVPPEEFLPEFRTRRDKRTSRTLAT